ncbi:MAG: SoxR reducing system RseC family protein [Desulfobacterales bacterium]
MAREVGVVTKIKGGNAMVKTQRAAACEGCSEKSTCHSMGGGKEMEIEALNPVHARVGDRVTLEFASGKMLQLSLLLYIFPIIALLAGAIIGNETAAGFGFDASVFSALTGFGGFFLSLAAIMSLEKKARRSDRFKPTITGARHVPRQDTGSGVEKCGVCH